MEKVNGKLECLTDEFGNLYYDVEAYRNAVNYELGTKEGVKTKSIEIAKNLLKKKMNISFISEVTNLQLMK